MTDYHAGYVVTLKEDVRDEGVQYVLNALRMITGVLSVEPIVSDYQLRMAEERARDEVRAKVRELLFGKDGALRWP